MSIKSIIKSARTPIIAASLATLVGCAGPKWNDQSADRIPLTPSAGVRIEYQGKEYLTHVYRVNENKLFGMQLSKSDYVVELSRTTRDTTNTHYPRTVVETGELIILVNEDINSPYGDKTDQLFKLVKKAQHKDGYDLGGSDYHNKSSIETKITFDKVIETEDKYGTKTTCVYEGDGPVEGPRVEAGRAMMENMRPLYDKATKAASTGARKPL